MDVGGERGRMIAKTIKSQKEPEPGNQFFLKAFFDSHNFLPKALKKP